MTRTELLARYDVPVPRYTSYPTVPAWRTTPQPEQWIDALRRGLTAADGSLSVYIHIPFCESLCTFCGCNTITTRDHGRERPYVDLVLKELDLYLKKVPELRDAPVQQIHLGGGTPTFLAPERLERLLAEIDARLPRRDAHFEGSIEVDPRVTAVEHLKVLREHAFTRVSLGVQDVDPEVQHLVNRHQPIEKTESLCDMAREHGFASINLDLIYGLPGQTPGSIDRLADVVLPIAPDRLAVYSFARVPWIKPAHRRFRDDQVPTGAAKRKLYERIRGRLVDAGYLELGLDHFASSTDALALAAAGGRLHRNFMGYTDVRTSVLLGLGVSAISETHDCYHQNEKVLPVYGRRVEGGEVPTLRGHLLSAEDQRRQRAITSLMTQYGTRIDSADVAASGRQLRALVEDGIVEIEGEYLTVLPTGRAFLRHAAALFDEYLDRDTTGTPRFSTAV